MITTVSSKKNAHAYKYALQIILNAQFSPIIAKTLQSKVVPEGWAFTVSRLTLAVIFSITPFL